ncbi:MAG: hypothetical protein ABL858_01225 [Candidatus Nitrotoga sp.]
MLILRLLLIFTVISLVACIGMYLYTRNRRYLRLAKEIVRFVIFLLLIFGALYFLERYVLVGWKVLI